MKILVVGSGGREDAMVHTLFRSGHEVLAAPGNAGIAARAACFGIRSDDIAGLAQLASDRQVDFTVVGPEAPLVAGIADEFGARGLQVIGPSKAAAQLEGSKVFAKEFCRRHKIPTAPFQVFNDYQDACLHVRERVMPCVVKADGLAAGKGVFVARTLEEALAALHTIMVEKKFKAAGSRVLIEDCLVGVERSFFILVAKNGEDFVWFDVAQDYKRALDGDQGDNTGGMGGYAPVFIESVVDRRIVPEIVVPTLYGLIGEKMPFHGFLYFGLMMTLSGPQVLEFNVRFGDPEAQLLLPFLWREDLGALLHDAITNCLVPRPVGNWPRHRVCVVLASKGYPGDYPPDLAVTGLKEIESHEHILVFHAGTKLTPDGKNVLTAGGRVLNVVGTGASRDEARARAYPACEHIKFGGSRDLVHYRTDIAK